MPESWGKSASSADRPDPENVILKNGELAASANQVLSALEAQGVVHETSVHEPLYTVEQAKRIVYEKPGAHTKNLFLRNKKGRMLLLVVEQDYRVDLRGLRDRLQIPGGHFAFASTQRLAHYLGVVPGSVSPLAMHPCRNTHSTRLRVADLRRVLSEWNHPVLTLEL